MEENNELKKDFEEQYEQLKKEENKQKKRNSIFLVIIFSLIFIIILIATTLTIFKVKQNMSKKPSSNTVTKEKQLSVSYESGNIIDITINDTEWGIQKEFKVKNEGKLTTAYNILLTDINTDFEDFSNINVTLTKDGQPVISEQDLYPNEKTLLDTVTISTNEEQIYVLTFNLKNPETFESYIGKLYKAEIEIETINQ